MARDIRHDESARRFSIVFDGEEAYLQYAMTGERVMDTIRTYTPPSARGQGVAARLVRAALDHARENGWRVIPSCWYVDGYIERHPEYEDLRVG